MNNVFSRESDCIPWNRVGEWTHCGPGCGGNATSRPALQGSRECLQENFSGRDSTHPHLQSNFSKLTCYIICGVNVTLPEYRRLQRFEKLHSVDLSSVLMLESGFQQLLAGSHPSTATLQEVIAVQDSDYITIDAALELPWGRTGGVKRAPSAVLAGIEVEGRRVARRAAHHGGSLAESPIHSYSAQSNEALEHVSPAALQLPLPPAALAPAPPAHPPIQAYSSAGPSAAPVAPLSHAAHVYAPTARQHKPMTAAQHSAAVAKHRPCAQDIAAGLRVVSVLEALLAQRAALAHIAESM